MELNLNDNVALVTGSATGLGHSCAEALSREGVNVALVSPNIDDLAYASDRLHALGDGEIFALEADVRSPGQVQSFVEETVEQYGGIDHVVTGPRQLEPEAFLDVTDEDWFRAFDRSFMSVVWTLRETSPYLSESDHGTVVNVTSPVIPSLATDLPVANAFSDAVRGLTRTQAAALAPSIRLNTIVPGPHEVEDMELLLTELVDEGYYPDLDAAWTSVLADTPFESPGDPLALGTAVAFLSSEYAQFINGATVPVDGGSTQ
jgi:NAD(P)-dependent dehydrogenase (short-subunit alcohol dehydrogenase family)